MNRFAKAFLVGALLGVLTALAQAQLSVTPDPNNPGKPFQTTAGPPAVGQTAKTFVGRATTSASVTTPVALYTVTTGKTFYVTDVVLSSVSTVELDCQIQAAGTTVFRACVTSTAPCNVTGIDTQPQGASAQAMTLLLPIATGTPSVDYYIAGYEQ